MGGGNPGEILGERRFFDWLAMDSVFIVVNADIGSISCDLECDAMA